MLQGHKKLCGGTKNNNGREGNGDGSGNVFGACGERRVQRAYSETNAVIPVPFEITTPSECDGDKDNGSDVNSVVL